MGDRSYYRFGGFGQGFMFYFLIICPILNIFFAVFLRFFLNYRYALNFLVHSSLLIFISGVFSFCRVLVLGECFGLNFGIWVNCNNLVLT